MPSQKSFLRKAIRIPRRQDEIVASEPDDSDGNVEKESLKTNSSDSEKSKLRSRSAKRRPRAADAMISSDNTISESSSDESAETFYSSLEKVEAIKDHLNTTLKMVDELEQDLLLQEKEQEK